MKKTNIFGLVLILSTLLIGCAQSSPDEDIPEVYTITAAETTNGTISLSKTTAAAGETITVTATPASGYNVFDIKVGDNHLVISANNTAEFTMPSSNVTVSVTFISNVTPIQLYKGTTRLENNLNNDTFTLGNSDYGLLPNIGEGITYSKLRVFVSDNNIIGLGNIRYKPIDFDWESSVLRIYLQVSDN